MYFFGQWIILLQHTTDFLVVLTGMVHVIPGNKLRDVTESLHVSVHVQTRLTDILMFFTCWWPSWPDDHIFERKGICTVYASWDVHEDNHLSMLRGM